MRYFSKLYQKERKPYMKAVKKIAEKKLRKTSVPQGDIDGIT